MEIEELDNYLFTLKRKGTVKGSPQSTTRCIQRSRGFVEGRLSPRRRNTRRRLSSTHYHGNQGRVTALMIFLGWLGPVSVVRETICEWLPTKSQEKKQVFQIKNRNCSVGRAMWQLNLVIRTYKKLFAHDRIANKTFQFTLKNGYHKSAHLENFFCQHFLNSRTYPFSIFPNLNSPCLLLLLIIVSLVFLYLSKLEFLRLDLKAILYNATEIIYLFLHHTPVRQVRPCLSYCVQDQDSFEKKISNFKWSILRLLAKNCIIRIQLNQLGKQVTVDGECRSKRPDWARSFRLEVAKQLIATRQRDNFRAKLEGASFCLIVLETLQVLQIRLAKTATCFPNWIKRMPSKYSRSSYQYSF